MIGFRSKTVRILEIAELLGVTHQRASKIADEPGFPAPVGREGQRAAYRIGARSRRGRSGGGARSLGASRGTRPTMRRFDRQEPPKDRQVGCRGLGVQLVRRSQDRDLAGLGPVRRTRREDWH
jgi:hypothetical protein